MPIKIINRSMDIPVQDRNIGFTGDNLVETQTFKLNRFYGEVDLFEFDFKLDTEINGVKNIIDLDKSVNDDKITLTWTVRESHILNPGHMSIQIRAFKGDVEKWHSAQDYVLVQSSINATEAIPDPLPSEFEQMEQRVTAAKNATLEAAEQVDEDKQTVAADKRTVLEKAAEALQSAANALASEENAHTSAGNAKESETSALGAMGVAVQAMTDLLAMMGEDIATLTDGKLTPSQIPDLSINDVFEVADTDEMLTLTAQRGDCALIIPDDVVTDSYILAADDPTVLANWKKLGVSYVANAGHALTADNATNATKINGHGLVRFDTLAELEAAVKIEGTLYYAPYDEE